MFFTDPDRLSLGWLRYILNFRHITYEKGIFALEIAYLHWKMPTNVFSLHFKILSERYLWFKHFWKIDPPCLEFKTPRKNWNIFVSPLEIWLTMLRVKKFWLTWFSDVYTITLSNCHLEATLYLNPSPLKGCMYCDT